MDGWQQIKALSDGEKRDQYTCVFYTGLGVLLLGSSGLQKNSKKGREFKAQESTCLGQH